MGILIVKKTGTCGHWLPVLNYSNYAVQVAADP